jgi:putative oxidoreductase
MVAPSQFQFVTVTPRNSNPCRHDWPKARNYRTLAPPKEGSPHPSITGFDPAVSVLTFVLGSLVQRLFSTFASGWPGAGLFFIRLVAGIALMDRGVTRLSSDPSIQLTVVSVLAIGAGLLFIAGLWTPVAGTLVAVIEVWNISLLPRNLWIYILLGAIGASLAMIGPGAWSIDARLFGRKHIDIWEG